MDNRSLLCIKIIFVKSEICVLISIIGYTFIKPILESGFANGNLDKHPLKF